MDHIQIPPIGDKMTGFDHQESRETATETVIIIEPMIGRGKNVAQNLSGLD